MAVPMGESKGGVLSLDLLLVMSWDLRRILLIFKVRIGAAIDLVSTHRVQTPRLQAGSFSAK